MLDSKAAREGLCRNGWEGTVSAVMSSVLTPIERTSITGVGGRPIVAIQLVPQVSILECMVLLELEVKHTSHGLWNRNVECEFRLTPILIYYDRLNSNHL